MPPHSELPHEYPPNTTPIDPIAARRRRLLHHHCRGMGLNALAPSMHSSNVLKFTVRPSLGSGGPPLTYRMHEQDPGGITGGIPGFSSSRNILEYILGQPSHADSASSSDDDEEEEELSQALLEGSRPLMDDSEEDEEIISCSDSDDDIAYDPSALPASTDALPLALDNFLDIYGCPRTPEHQHPMAEPSTAAFPELSSNSEPCLPDYRRILPPPRPLPPPAGLASDLTNSISSLPRWERPARKRKASEVTQNGDDTESSTSSTRNLLTPPTPPTFRGMRPPLSRTNYLSPSPPPPFVPPLPLSDPRSLLPHASLAQYLLRRGSSGPSEGPEQDMARPGSSNAEERRQPHRQQKRRRIDSSAAPTTTTTEGNTPYSMPRR